jgi:hypothetical protein
MSLLRRSLPRLLLVGALVLGNASGALAFFTATGLGTATATVGLIAGPTAVSAVQSGKDVTVSWSAATLTGGGAVQGYTVTRSDGTSTCGSPTLVTTLACTDSSVPTGTYTYTVRAVYRTFSSSSTSGSIAVLTAPTITTGPASLTRSATASFSFAGGGGSAYQCQLDSGSYTTCTSPASYSGVADGSHTFNVRAVQGSGAGPVAAYTWTVDATPPTQTVSLAAGATGAYMSGTTLYYKADAAGTFRLIDSVTDRGSAPASAAFPAIATTGWTHAAETVTTPSGGPYSSSALAWTANAAVPAGYSVTGADVAGNTSAAALTFTNDTTAPSGGALTVNGTAATTAGSPSATTSTSFAIGGRTDYTDAGAGLKSSVLTVQSETLSGSRCGALGSGGPFTSPATITGTTQPSGVQAGFCYVYTLTGTDNVGNIASISTSVAVNVVGFVVTAQPTSVTASTPTAANAVVLTAIKNGAPDTTYTGSALTWSGAKSSPSGATPALPTTPTWTGGQASFGITLVQAETETLTVTDGTRSATLAPITINPGVAANLAWTNVGTTSPGGLPSPCLFTCSFASGFGNNATWSAGVSVTDADGNTVSNLGASQTVTITLGGQQKGTVAPTTLTIPASGPAQSTGQTTYTSRASGSFSDTLTAAGGSYASATAAFNR